MPKIPALVGFGTAFAFGWILHRQAAAARRAREAVAREPGARRGPHERVPRDRRHRAELGRGHRDRGRRRHARRLHGLLHGGDLVLDVRLDRRGHALLLAAERAAPLSRRLVVLALSRPPADRVLSPSGVDEGAVALGDQVPADRRDHAHGAARELPLSRAADVHRRAAERPQVSARQARTDREPDPALRRRRPGTAPARHTALRSAPMAAEHRAATSAHPSRSSRTS